MLLPALVRAKDAAVRIECANNQRQLALHIELYYSDNEWYPQQHSGLEGNYTEGWVNKVFSGDNRRFYMWHNTSSRAVKQYEAPYFCRKAPKAWDLMGITGWESLGQQYARSHMFNHTSYQLNDAIFGLEKDQLHIKKASFERMAINNNSSYWGNSRLYTLRIFSSGDTVPMMFAPLSNQLGGWLWNDPLGNNGGTKHNGAFYAHRGYANVMMMDGHLMTLKQPIKGRIGKPAQGREFNYW
jgi:prepilin-type processing-associated H-X9-DG protein